MTLGVYDPEGWRDKDVALQGQVLIRRPVEPSAAAAKKRNFDKAFPQSSSPVGGGPSTASICNNWQEGRCHIGLLPLLLPAAIDMPAKHAKDHIQRRTTSSEGLRTPPYLFDLFAKGIQFVVEADDFIRILARLLSPIRPPHLTLPIQFIRQGHSVCC